MNDGKNGSNSEALVEQFVWNFIENIAPRIGRQPASIRRVYTSTPI